MKILQITAHLGGGVGQAISAMAIWDQQKKSHQHEIILLEEPENTYFAELCRSSRIPAEYIAPENQKEIARHMEEADIILLNWWDHPAMNRFLAEMPKVKGRFILWCHVNGCHYPHIPFSFLKPFSQILFTTPYSYENPFWTKAEKRDITEKSEVVYGMSSLSCAPKETYECSSPFRVGYVGTLNYAKIHPQFFLYVDEAQRRLKRQVKFIMVGEASPELTEDGKQKSLSDIFEWTGYQPDVKSYLRSFDVFAYPLNPIHFGATENALLEAMASALPIVALRQNTEKFIIEDERTGLLVDSPSEYADALKRLQADRNLREHLGQNAREEISNRFSLFKNMQRFYRAIGNAFLCDKKILNCSEAIGNSPIDWFLTFTGSYREKLLSMLSLDLEGEKEELEKLMAELPLIFRQKHKSSIYHFANYFERELSLQKLKRIMNLYDRMC